MLKVWTKLGNFKLVAMQQWHSSFSPATGGRKIDDLVDSNHDDQVLTQPSSATAMKSDPRLIHAQAIVSATSDLSLYNQLITLYSKSSHFSHSLRLFHQISSPDVVSWTALISAHANTFLSLQHFVSMLRRPTLPNQRTLASLIKTCAALSCFSFGFSLHSLAHKLSLCAESFSGSAFVNFYSKCRLPNDARKVFDEIRHLDEVCYSAAIVGLAQNNMPRDAFSLFNDMRKRDIASTMHSISGVLRALARLATSEQCRIVHAHAVVTGLDSNAIVGSALIDGYGKSGLVLDARQVFDENLHQMNIVGWNAMMAAYAQHGDKNLVIHLFNAMKGQGHAPDEYSFLAILSAYCNAGLVVETELWLTRMKSEYALDPMLEHYTCLIDAMGRVGRLKDAEMISMTMPHEPDAAVWRALLSNSARHGEGDMAWSMAKRLLEFNPHDDSAYVIVANALSGAGRWDEVAEVRKMMKNRGVKKKVGRSWIEDKGEVYVFLAGDRNSDRADEIYLKLAELLTDIEKLGYVPIWDEMFHEVGEKEKKEALWYHSEKLALAFGLLSGAAPPGKALRIVKNLKICKDCHEVFKYSSKLLEKEIIVRDVNRYHRFIGGRCVCRDIW